MNKISHTDLTEISIITGHGGSWSQAYNANYKGSAVVIKAQEVGSREKTNPDDDKFSQSINTLETGLPGCVSLVGAGDDFNGERFIVLEKLFPLTEKDYGNRAEEICDFTVLTHRQLYIHGLLWIASMNHVMKDAQGNLKAIDFNDDQEHGMTYTDSLDPYGVLKTIQTVSDISGKPLNELRDRAFNKLIETEYQSLENVHQPIYFKNFSAFLRTETESDDPLFLKLVPPNRSCIDRADLLTPILEGIDSALDIGCNAGWFCFWMAEKKIDVTGLDFDFPGIHRPESWKNGNGGKIDFNRMMGEFEKNDAKFVRQKMDIEYARNMKSYDLVIALSILHLLFTQQKIKKDEWIQLFTSICEKVNKIFIMEVPDTMPHHLGETSINSLMLKCNAWGNFRTSHIIGRSEIGRKIIVFEKN